MQWGEVSAWGEGASVQSVRRGVRRRGDGRMREGQMRRTGEERANECLGRCVVLPTA